MDWAETLAENLCESLEDGDFAAVVPNLITALRKAKADGMREAATFDAEWRLKTEVKTFSAFQIYCAEGYDALMSRAIEIEKGNA